MENASLNRAITPILLIKKIMEQKIQLFDVIRKEWLFYASKTNIFDVICKKYNQFEHYIMNL